MYFTMANNRHRWTTWIVRQYWQLWIDRPRVSWDSIDGIDWQLPMLVFSSKRSIILWAFINRGDQCQKFLDFWALTFSAHILGHGTRSFAELFVCFFVFCWEKKKDRSKFWCFLFSWHEYCVLRIDHRSFQMWKR